MAKKTITLSIDPDLAEQFEQFVLMENFGSKNQAMNAILRAHFGATPELGLAKASQERALAETRQWLTGRVKNFLHETTQLLEATTK